MGALNNTQFNQRVWQLVQEIQQAGNETGARGVLSKQFELLTDRRLLPTLFETLDTLTTEERARAFGIYLGGLVREILLQSSPTRFGRGGAVNILWMSDSDIFDKDVKHLRELLDDTFFDEWRAALADANARGIVDLAHQGEGRMQAAMFLLALVRLDELRAEFVKTRTPHVTAEFLVKVASKMPRWFAQGLEHARGTMEEQNAPRFEMTLVSALRRSQQQLTSGQHPKAVIQDLEHDPHFQAYVEHYSMSRAAHQPDLSYIPAEQLPARMLALAEFVRAENRAQQEQAIENEPALLQPDAEGEAERLAREANAYGDRHAAQRLERATEQLRALRDELSAPEQNEVMRLAARVTANELDLNGARAELTRPSTKLRITIPHLSAIDARVSQMRRGGNLEHAEILATLNQYAAKQFSNRKMQMYADVSLAEMQIERGAVPLSLDLLAEAERAAKDLGDQDTQIYIAATAGTAWQTLGNLDRARTQFESALSLARQAKMRHHEIAALDSLASINLLMGKPNDALPLSQQALEMAQELGDEKLYRRVLGNRAVALQGLGRNREAIEQLQRALERALSEHDRYSELQIRSHLGQAYAEMGDLESAEREIGQALELAQETANRTMQAGLLATQAALYYRRGNLNQALPLFERALKLEEILGHSEKQALILTNLAQIHLRLQQIDTAEQMLERAQHIAQEIGSLRLQMGIVPQLGRIAQARADWQHAEQYYRDALELAEQNGEPSNRIIALGNLGHVLEKQNQLIKAAPFHETAIELASKFEMLPLLAQALVNFGVVKAKQNETAAAREALERAAQVAHQIGNPYDEFYAYENLGRLYQFTLNDLPNAVRSYQHAVQLLEAQRTLVAEYEIFETQLVQDKTTVYRLAAEAYFKLNQPLAALEMLEKGRARLLERRLLRREALPPSVPEELRSRYARFVEAVQFLRTIVYGEPTWGMQVMQEVRQAAADLQNRPLDLAKEKEEYKRELMQAEDELEHILADLRVHVPNFAAFESELPRVNFAELAQDSETAIVVLFIGSSTSQAVVLHPSGTRVIDLPYLQEVDVEHVLNGFPEPLALQYQQAQQQIGGSRDSDQIGNVAMFMHYMTLRYMIEQSDSFELGWQTATRTLIGEKNQAIQLERIRQYSPPIPREKTLFDIDETQRLKLWQRAFEITAQELHTRLWQPLLPALREYAARRVVIIPDANLHSLPLATGLAQESNAPSVMFAPSLTLYAQCTAWLRERPPRENSLMLIAPDASLGAAKLEARLLRDLFASHDEQTYALQETQATQLNVVRTCRVGNYWHFAGHALYVWQNPAVSALSLADGESLPLYWLQMWMDFRATRLAVLSACETGMTPTRDPTQEYAGLFASFLSAGVPTVLASLYPVESISTALLVYRFYQYHLGDPLEDISPRAPIDALRDAQVWLRDLSGNHLAQHPIVKLSSKFPTSDPIWGQLFFAMSQAQPFANPHYWAGFVIAGA